MGGKWWPQDRDKDLVGFGFGKRSFELSHEILFLETEFVQIVRRWEKKH